MRVVPLRGQRHKSAAAHFMDVRLRYVMDTNTKRWGIRGAIYTAAFGSVLVAFELWMAKGVNDASISRQTILYHLVWDDLCYPVLLVWQIVLKLFGLQGDYGVMFNLLLFASVLVYFGVFGFVAGLLLKRVFRFT